MKAFKKTLSAVLAVLMVLSLCTVFAGATQDKNETTVTGENLKANWTTHGVKYSSKTDKAIPKATDSPEFKFSETEDGGIFVDVPTPKELAGVYGVTLTESNYTTPLDDLTVTVKPEDFGFTGDGIGLPRTIGMIFTESKVDSIYSVDEFNQAKGLYWGAQEAGTNGLRHMLPMGGKGVCVNVTGFYWAEKVDPIIAASVGIIYFDGSFYNNGYDDRPGFRWVFTAAGTDEAVYGSNVPGNERINEKLYSGEGITFHFEPDTTHGYIVSVNGKEYYSIKDCGFGPDQILYEDGSFRRLSEESGTIEPADWDVYLNDLVGVEGYVGIGSASNRDDYNEKADYTIKTVNGIPAAQWKGEANTHVCTPGETVHALAPDCTTFGIDIVKCTECGAVISSTVIDAIDPVGGHSFGDWTVTAEPTYTADGLQTRTCTKCGKTETTAIAKKVNPFTDVALGKWYTEPCLWAYENDYMSGLTATTFGPNDKLTRAQFVQILAKLEGVDFSTIKYQDKFSDVPAGKWYTNAVMWAVDFGVTGGVGGGKFGPNDNVTRAQLAQFFSAYATKKGCDMTKVADIAGYSDYASVPNWAKTAMSWAVGNSIISSAVSGQKVLDPNGLATRAQVAVMFKGFSAILPKAE